MKQVCMQRTLPAEIKWKHAASLTPPPLCLLGLCALWQSRVPRRGGAAQPRGQPGVRVPARPGPAHPEEDGGRVDLSLCPPLPISVPLHLHLPRPRPPQGQIPGSLLMHRCPQEVREAGGAFGITHVHDLECIFFFLYLKQQKVTQPKGKPSTDSMF